MQFLLKIYLELTPISHHYLYREGGLTNMTFFCRFRYSIQFLTKHILKNLPPTPLSWIVCKHDFSMYISTFRAIISTKKFNLIPTATLEPMRIRLHKGPLGLCGTSSISLGKIPKCIKAPIVFVKSSLSL